MRSPEFVSPRVNILEKKRIVRTELAPDTVVELVHLREVIVEVRNVLDVVEGSPALGFGSGLDLGDDTVEDAGALALGEGREFRVGRGASRRVRGGLENGSVSEGSIRDHGHEGIHPESDKGFLQGKKRGVGFHANGSEGVRYGE